MPTAPSRPSSFPVPAGSPACSGTPRTRPRPTPSSRRCSTPSSRSPVAEEAGMTEHGVDGLVVNFASANGMRGAAGYGAYNSSKEEIRALTRTAAREWGADGIVVNCVAPASVAHRLPPMDEHRRAAYAAGMADHPIGRDGDPEA